MYCPKCKVDVGNTEFCETCGAATVGNLAKEEAAATTAALHNDDLITFDSIKATVKKFPIKKLIITSLLIAVAIAAFIGYKALEFYYSPGQIADRFVNALVAGDYDTAFDMLEGTDDKFITKDYFVKFMELKNVKGKNIVSLQETDKPVDDMLFDFFGSSQQKTNKTIIDEEAKYFTSQIDLEFLSMTLVKRGKANFLFENWKINAGDFTTSWNITVPKGARVTVDGIPIEKIKETASIEKSGLLGIPAKNTVTFIVENIFPGEYELTSTMEGAKALNIQASTDTAQVLNFEPTDNLVADLRQVADNFLNLYYTNAGKDSFTGIVNPECMFIQNLGNSWYDKRSQYKNLKLTGIETTDKSIQDKDHAQLTVKALFQYDYEVWNWFESKTETRQEEQQYTMSFVRDSSGKWIIDEINTNLF